MPVALALTNATLVYRKSLPVLSQVFLLLVGEFGGAALLDMLDPRPDQRLQ